MNLLEIRAAKPGDLPFSIKTIYKFRSLHKYPRLIIKVGGKLFFDLEEWDRMCQEAITKQVKEAKRTNIIGC